MTGTGVLLVTLGGPRTRDEVPLFLRRFAGRDLPPPALRAVTERYDLIGGCSPLDPITERQAAALEAELGPGFVCRAAFRHSEPSIEAQLAALRGWGIDRLVFLPASPFFASVTTGSYLDHAKRMLAGSGWGLDVLFVHGWYDHPSYVAAWADKLARGPFDRDATWLFCAHSLPARLSSEPYGGQIEATAAALASRLALAHWRVAWQSVPAGAREPWLGPQVEDVLRELAGQGVRRIVQVPVGFTADHIETLYDNDILHREQAAKLGLDWHRVPSLNDDPPFIRALAQVVRGALAHPDGHRG